jgi:hypothetical protein
VLLSNLLKERAARTPVRLTPAAITRTLNSMVILRDFTRYGRHCANYAQTNPPVSIAFLAEYRLKQDEKAQHSIHERAMPTKLVTVIRLPTLLVLLLWAVPFHGQPAPYLTPAQAQALVKRALATEVRTAQDASHPMRYWLRKSSPRLTTTKEIVETRDGFVARLIRINGRPLGPADEQAEKTRLDALYDNPGRQQHRKRGEERDTAIVLKLLRMLPQAFTYDYAGPGQEAQEKIEKFRFHPNPGFNPPDLETKALTAMSGEIWLDATEERVTRLEGHLQQDTVYGWGLLGRLDRGGWLVIEQADVGGRQWRITRFQMKMNLRVLFKTKVFDTVEEMTRYTPVPDGMNYRQAIQMLRSEPGGR